MTFKIADAIPNEIIVWLVTDCYLHSFSDKTEWNETKIVFEISEQSNLTEIDMTHVGLMPEIECYESCEKGWDFFVKQSL